MSPDRKRVIGDQTITEYYWAGKMVVYVNNRAYAGSFDGAVAAAEARQKKAASAPA